MESVKVTCTYGDMNLKKMLTDLAGTEHQHKVSEKFSGNHAPYGYTIINKTLVVDQDAAEIVRKIFRLKIAGNSNQHIGELLNEQQVKSPLEHRIQNGISANGEHLRKGDKAEWSAATVRRILENPVYTCSSHEAIVSETEYAVVQKLLERDNGKSKVSHLLSGFAYCGSCGSQLYHRKDASRPAYWFCKNAECKCKQCVREDALSDIIRKELLEKIKPTSDVVGQPNEHEQSRLNDLKKKIEHYRASLSYYQRQMDLAADPLQEQEEAIHYYNGLIQKIAAEISKIEKLQILNLEAGLTRECVALFIQKITVDKDKIGIQFRFGDDYSKEEAT